MKEREQIAEKAVKTMKKLYRKGRVHPSSLTHQQNDHMELLSTLPATILTLMAALCPEDREVLAYLIYSSGNGKKKSNRKGEHPPMFHCNCFRCYTSFWVRWDSSPDRQVIHEILEAYEDRGGSGKESDEVVYNGRNEMGDSGMTEIGSGGDESEGEKSSMRRFMSFVGERIWGVWNQ